MYIYKMSGILAPLPMHTPHASYQDSNLRNLQPGHTNFTLNNNQLFLHRKSLRTCLAARSQRTSSGNKTNADNANSAKRQTKSIKKSERLETQQNIAHNPERGRAISELDASKKTITGKENALEHKWEKFTVQETTNGAARTSRKHAAVTKVQNNGLRQVHTQPRSVHDYMEQVPAHVKRDDGPPRWFCPLECGRPEQNAPLLLFLPGMDGTGLGLILHYGSLAKIFEVRCLHIPIMDRTPIKGLIEIVEQSLKEETTRSTSRPIYLVGDSLGGALALAVAARNPSMDLSLVLANPATCFHKSYLQPLLPILEVVPSGLYQAVPFLLSLITGDPIRMALAKVESRLSPLEKVQELSNSIAALLPTLPVLADIVPNSTLLWKLELAKLAAIYTNSRLHAVRAEVLILASGKDQLLPSSEEAKRLKNILQKCTVRFFKDSGHALLLEEGIDLATIIRGAGFYRRSKNHDFASDFVYPTVKEFERTYDDTKFIRQLSSPVFFSTKKDGRIVKGLSGIPKEQPIMLVGNHMLMGLELGIMVSEILKQQNRLIRGIAHPYLFYKEMEGELTEFGFNDKVSLFGGVPATKRSFIKVLTRGESILLYPGGAREALHRKGEAYKLFWPQESEFTRAAARFDVTIVPFGVVGEDDMLEILLDYNDLMKIPPVRDFFTDFNKKIPRLRTDEVGEVANQDFYLPVMAPKLPGRLYYLFGKPFPTAGRIELRDKSNAQILYKEVKREVEACMEYLQTKRKEDPFRGLLSRLLYESLFGQAPTFKL